MAYTNIIKSRVETESNLGFVLSNQSSSNCSQKKATPCCGGNSGCSDKSTSCQNGSVTSTNGSSSCSDGTCAKSTSTSSLAHNTSDTSEDEATKSNSSKRRKFGRTYDLPEDAQIEDYTIFYVGDESPTLSNIMMTHSKCEVYSYNPEKKQGRLESAQVNKALMRRYFLVQKAKDADVIGIAVGTLGVGKLGISTLDP